MTGPGAEASVLQPEGERTPGPPPAPRRGCGPQRHNGRLCIGGLERAQGDSDSDKGVFPKKNALFSRGGVSNPAVSEVTVAEWLYMLMAFYAVHREVCQKSAATLN